MGNPEIIYIEPDEWDWIPPQARTLQEAFEMGRKPPVQMTREELEKLYPPPKP